jgi:hypothetical protein
VIVIENLKEYISNRIKDMDIKTFTEVVENLKAYNIRLFNDYGQLDYNKFKNDCSNIYKLLYKNNCDSNVRYEYIGFINILQTITGVRNLSRFLSELNPVNFKDNCLHIDFDKIRKLINSFYYNKEMKPNYVIMSEDTLTQIKKNNEYNLYCGIKGYEIFGISIAISNKLKFGEVEVV